MKNLKSRTLTGAGGGGSKKQSQPTQYTPVEASNNLFSVSKGRILDLLAHGPIVGLVDGMKSVYLDDTPLQNPDGSYNFSGVTVHTREGYPDQSVIPGFRQVENPIDVSSKVSYGSPVVRTLSNRDADAVLVVVRFDSLVSQKSNGDLVGASVNLSVEFRAGNGGWSTGASGTVSGKTNSPYERSYRVELPSPGNWEIRVTRHTPDSTSSNVRDAFYWTTLTEIVDARLSYPDSALVGIELDAKLFGNQIPSRSYDVKLSIIRVPSNYNPETREYTGLWNGSFKMAWTDNPAWIYYDLATHPVIGAGLTGVDKWALYQIGQYCDERVPDGYGTTEPRFTVNTLFASREEAIVTLSTLASAFRGMTYWGTNTVMAVADMPADPKKLVSPANVVNGEFEYSGTSLKERHSVAIVMWNDPEDNYKAKPEFVEDSESIDLFGWREVQATAVGCTSRGQAHRLGAWILYSERMETQTVSYSATADHADLRPGDIISLSDPDRAGARMSGRILVSGTSSLVLDKVPEQVSGTNWYLNAVLPNGSIERRQVSSFSGDRVTLLTPFSVEPIVGAMWMLSGTSLVPPQYRVVSNSEQSNGATYKVTATEYDPGKYSLVEQGLKLPDTSHSFIPSGPISPPTAIEAEAYTYLAGGTEHQGLFISWSPSQDPRVLSYVAEVQGPQELTWRTVSASAATSVQELDAESGDWMIRVKAQGAVGTGSAWASRVVTIAEDRLLPKLPLTVDVEESTFSVVLRPRSNMPGANYEFWRSTSALQSEQIQSNAVQLSVSSSLVDTGLRSDTTYFYYIRGANAYGVSTGWYPVQAKTKEDFDDILKALDTDIRRPGGLFDAMVGEASQGVNQQIADALGDTTQAIADTRLELGQTRADTTQAIADTRLELGQTRADITEDVAEVREAAESALRSVEGLFPGVASLQAGVTELQWANELESVRHLGLVAMQKGATSLVTVEQQTRTDETSALSTQLTQVKSNFEANSATVSELLTTLTSADSALSARIVELESSVGEDIAARLTEESLTRADADSALASRVDTLEAQVSDEILAAISTEQLARASADEALAQVVTSLEAQVSSDITAAITAEQTARTTLEGSIAGQLSSISALTTTAKDTADGKGKVLYQSTPPATPDRLAQNLWIDTTDGANTPKRWDGSNWVAVTDKVAVDAAAAVVTEQAARTSALASLASSMTRLEAALAGSGGNLLANSSFEEALSGSDLADGWVLHTGGSEGGTAALVPGRLGGQAQAVTMTQPSTSAHGISASPGTLVNPWVPGTPYVVSFYAKKQGGEGFAGCNLDWSSAPQAVTVLLNPDLSSEWQRYAFRIEWDAGADVPLSLWITRTGESVAGDQIVFDDVQVQEGEQLTGYVESVSANRASITQQFTAQTSYTDGAVARAITTATVNGKKAVFGISSDGEVAEIGAVADRFYVYNPVAGSYTSAFSVAGGKTVIQDALIRDASIGTLKIAGQAVTIPVAASANSSRATTAIITLTETASFFLSAYCTARSSGTGSVFNAIVMEFGYHQINGGVQGGGILLAQEITGLTINTMDSGAASGMTVTATPGSYRFYIDCSFNTGIVTKRCSIFALGLKR